MLNNNYLILSATLIEIEPLLQCSTVLSESCSRSGIRTITARLGNSTSSGISAQCDNINFQIVVTGAGVVNASHGLTVCLESQINDHKWHKTEYCKPNLTGYNPNNIEESPTPLLIIQTGIAGFFEGSGLETGDIAVATSETYIHTGVDNATYPHKLLPFNLVPDCPISRRGHFIFEKAMVEKSCSIIETGINKSSSELIKNGLAELKESEERIKDKLCRVMAGNFITVSTITATPENGHNLFRAFNQPFMESMEGAASAHIAALYNIPFLEVRAGSNPVGVRSKDQWNIPLASQRASFAVRSLIERGDLLIKESCFENRTSIRERT